MKRILITGAGGSPSTNFVRSLRDAPERFHLIGADCNKYYLQRAETDERHLVPEADEPDYDRLLDRVDRKKVQPGNKKGKAAWSKLEDVLAERRLQKQLEDFEDDEA